MGRGNVSVREIAWAKSCDRNNRLWIERKVITVEIALLKMLVFILRWLGRGCLGMERSK